MNRRKFFLSTTYYYRQSSFTPLDDPELVFWFDNGDDSLVTLSSGDVTTQTDMTGNYTRSTTAPAANPEYITSNLVGDRKHIRYAGAEGLKLSVNGFNHSQGELFVVFRRHTTSSVGLTNNQVFMGVTQAGAANRFCLFSDFANTNSIGNSIGFQIQAGATNNQAFATTKSLSDKKIIANFRSTGSAYGMGFDRDLSRGITFNTGSDNGDWLGDIFAVSDNITFGYRRLSSGDAFGAYDEFEILYYNQVLSAEKRARVLAYLNNKHDCYADVTDKIGVIIHGTSNAVGQSATASLPNRLKVALPKGYIRTGTNTFANLLFGTNNEGNQYGPEMAFIAALSEYLNQDIYLEKSATSGSRWCVIDGSNPVTGGTTTWEIGEGDLYPNFETGCEELQTKMDTLGANKIIYFLIGGENDTFYAGDGSGWQANATAVIDGIEAAAPSITYYIINKIRTDLVGTGGAPTRQSGAITSVQTGQANIVTAKGSNAILLDMVNYSSAGDTVHFAGHQQLLIGRDAFDLIRPLL